MIRIGPEGRRDPDRRHARTAPATPRSRCWTRPQKLAAHGGLPDGRGEEHRRGTRRPRSGSASTSQYFRTREGKRCSRPDGSLWRMGRTDRSRSRRTGQRTFIRSPARILFSGHWATARASRARHGGLGFLSKPIPGSRGVLLRKIYADLRINTLRHLPPRPGDALWFAGLVGGERPGADFPERSSIDFIGVAGGRAQRQTASTDYSFHRRGRGAMKPARARGRWRWAVSGSGDLDPARSSDAANPDHPARLYHRFHRTSGQTASGATIQCDICRGASGGERPTIDEDTGEITLERWPCSAARREDKAQTDPECVVAGMNKERREPAVELPRAFKRKPPRERDGSGASEGENGLRLKVRSMKHSIQRCTSKTGRAPGPVDKPPIPSGRIPRDRLRLHGFRSSASGGRATRPSALDVPRDPDRQEQLVSAHADVDPPANRAQSRRSSRQPGSGRAREMQQSSGGQRSRRGRTSAPAPRFFGRFADPDAGRTRKRSSRRTLSSDGRAGRRSGSGSTPCSRPCNRSTSTGRCERASISSGDARVEMDDRCSVRQRGRRTRSKSSADTDGSKPKEGKGAKEETEPDNDHRMDAMRYPSIRSRQKGRGPDLQECGGDRMGKRRWRTSPERPMAR